MRTSSHLVSTLQRIWLNVRSLATNKYFGGGLLVLLAFIAAGYFLIDRILMPAYVGSDVSVAVPDVRELPIEEARLRLEQMDLRVEVESSRYNPQLPRDVVVDQNPAANRRVKPGRRIYLTINTGASPEATIPAVVGISLNEAINRLNAAGLTAEEEDIRPDPIPHPYPNTVTRQSPEAGQIVPEGSHVRLWYSTGLGEDYVSVPDLSGMRVAEAKTQLRSQRLNSIVLGAGSRHDADTLVVIRQSPEPGTRIREGSEIRMFVNQPESEQNR